MPRQAQRQLIPTILAIVGLTILVIGLEQRGVDLRVLALIMVLISGLGGFCVATVLQAMRAMGGRGNG